MPRGVPKPRTTTVIRLELSADDMTLIDRMASDMGHFSGFLDVSEARIGIARAALRNGLAVAAARAREAAHDEPADSSSDKTK